MKKFMHQFIVLFAVMALTAIAVQGAALAAQREKADRPVIQMVDPMASKLHGNSTADSTIIVYTDLSGQTVGIAEVPGALRSADHRRQRAAADASFEALMMRRPVYDTGGGSEGTAYCTKTKPIDCVCLNAVKDCTTVPVN
jgi:hypothetical protein